MNELIQIIKILNQEELDIINSYIMEFICSILENNIAA